MQKPLVSLHDVSATPLTVSVADAGKPSAGALGWIVRAACAAAGKVAVIVAAATARSVGRDGLIDIECRDPPQAEQSAEPAVVYATLRSLGEPFVLRRRFNFAVVWEEIGRWPAPVFACRPPACPGRPTGSTAAAASPSSCARCAWSCPATRASAIRSPPPAPSPRRCW